MGGEKYEQINKPVLVDFHVYVHIYDIMFHLSDETHYSKSRDSGCIYNRTERLKQEEK